MTFLQGIIPPMVTIFNEDYSIDWQGNGQLVDYLIEKGVDGIFIMGSIGEFTRLSIEERKKYTEFIIDKVGGRVPVLVGVGHTATGITNELSRHAEDAGADFLVAVTPYYWQLSDDALYSHYQVVASSTSLPVLLYNIPQLTNNDLKPELIAQLADDFSNIIGIKDSIDSFTHLKDIIGRTRQVKEGFCVLAGFDHYLLSTLEAGGDGIIGGCANFLPELPGDIFRAFQEGDYGRAIKLQKKLNQLVQIYDLASPPTAVIKEAIRIMTPVKVSTVVRRPGIGINKDVREELEKILQKF